MAMKSSLLILTTLVMLSGCFSVGRDFQASAAPSWIKPGETTKKQLQEKLGDPWRVGMDAGARSGTYGFYQLRLFGMSDNKDLVFRFDPKGVVKSYTLNTTFPDEQE